jgi:hypothetical protein
VKIEKELNIRIEDDWRRRMGDLAGLDQGMPVGRFLAIVPVIVLAFLKADEVFIWTTRTTL